MEQSNLDNSSIKDNSSKTEQNDSKLPKDLVLIYSTEDERIKEVGKLLVSDTSRQILKMLFSETLTAKQIAQRMDFDIPLAKHHIDRMLDLGIIKIAKITKSVKDRDVKCYTASHLAVVILSPSAVDNAKKSKLFIRSFRTIHKIATIGIAAISTWFGTQFLQHFDSKPELILDPNDPSDTPMDYSADLVDQSGKPRDYVDTTELPDVPWLDVQSDLLLSAISVSIVIIASVLFFIWHSRRK
ncbi:MAG: ArsR/SmtB family transcription factor [Nitrososphaerota archaeon]